MTNGDGAASFNVRFADGKLMLRVLMLLAEYERELIVARTRNTLGRHKKEIKEKGFFVSKDGKRVTKLGRPRGKKDKEMFKIKR